MKEITEFNDAISEYELFSFLYEKVLSRDITTFSGLKNYATPILKFKKSHPVLLRLFELIKTLNWGFFSVMTPTTHKKLWRELVIPDKTFPDAGDLKRTLSISNLYICMLDIHGYTKFCQDSRKNLSMLHALDKTINNEISHITTRCQAVSRRERGDEMVVVAATASDALTATLCIIDYFAKTNVVDDPNIHTQRTGDAIILPVFKISAGITGGNTTSPLIVTEVGDLSGFLLNAGARLQTRANELSPKDSRIMVSKQVYMNYAKENAGNDKWTIFKKNAVYFLDTGMIEFKGVLLPTCEAVFKPEERYKEQFSGELVTLYSSIKENLWEQKVYLDLIDLLSKASSHMPPFLVTPKYPINSMQTINNASFQQLCRIAFKTYMQDEDYTAAVALLHDFIEIMELVPQFDRLLVDYTKGVAEKYDILLSSFEKTIDQEIDDKASQIFPDNLLKTYNAAKNAMVIYDKLRQMGRKSPELTKKKALWYNFIKKYQDKMVMTLYSGKK